MIKFLNFVIAAFLVSSCIDKPVETIPDILTYNNIAIYSDLSNRLDRSPNDTAVISQLMEYFVTDCVKPGTKINDRSSISFSRVNFFRSKCLAAKIDVGETKSLEEKQLFVNNGSSTRNLSTSLIEFKKRVQCNYKERDTGGLDILSLIYNEVNSGNNVKKPSFIIGDNDTTKINYVNHLFIFTDGYLEYSKKDGDADFYYSQPQIEKVRAYCKAKKVSPEDAIKNNSDFRLRSLKSDNNKFINLYVMETYDRGLNEQKGTLTNTGNLSDNNILRKVWEDWAVESGYKSFVWKQITKPNSLTQNYIRDIIVR